MHFICWFSLLLSVSILFSTQQANQLDFCADDIDSLGSYLQRGVLPRGGSDAGTFLEVETADKLPDCVAACCKNPNCNVTFFIKHHTPACYNIECNKTFPEGCSPIKKNNTSEMFQNSYWLVLRSPDTKIVHHNQKCEVGLLECEQPKEECVPKSARSRSGVCMCVDGYTRSSSGLCTSMFDDGDPSEDVKPSEAPAATTTTATDTKIVHRNQKCEVGLLECEQPKEECVPKSARSRSGVCMCVDGYTRSSSGLCTSMFDDGDPSEDVKPSEAPAATTTATDTKIVHRNQKCEVGLLECEQPKEECVPKSARSRSGVCMCVDGYTRSSSGLCTNMFDDLSEDVKPSEAPAATTTTANHLILPPTSPESPEKSLIVSAGKNIKVSLPQKNVTLSAFVLSESVGKSDITYQWSLLSHPSGEETGQMNGINTASLKLSELREGTYTFKVVVTKNLQFGEAFVNVTVVQPSRQNQAPVARVKPAFQEIKSPNDVIIDGSSSTDDVLIDHYHWEEVSSPVSTLQSREEIGDLDKPLLVLKSLAPGNYTFKLTVTDKEKLQNSTLAYVSVIKDVDYPPKANAGSNVIISLPQNSVLLNGNGSRDDNEIVGYLWTKKSDDKLTADMSGVLTPYLQLSNLQVGDYTFTLEVTDSASQTSSADVNVFVRPETNLPPVSRAGSDQLVMLPVDVVSLNGSNSTDDKKIVSYSWTLENGPSSVKIEDSDREVASIHEITLGTYKFKLSVKDGEGLESSSFVTYTVERSNNRAPVAKGGGDLVIDLPASIVTINGSSSEDDKGITSYLWTRDKNSPASGDIVFETDHQAALQLTNIISGRYKFILEVTDEEGLSSTDVVSLIVRPDPYKLNLINLHLGADVESFTERNKITLIDQLSLLLHSGGSQTAEVNIVIRRLTEDASSHQIIMTFYVESIHKGQREIWSSRDVISILKKKLRTNTELLDTKVLKFETFVCQNNCSGHGVCNQMTKRCVCSGFWMENFFAANFGEQESNCDWSILYVIVIIFSIIVAFVISSWVFICLYRRCSRCKSKPKRHRYMLLQDVDEDGKMKPGKSKKKNGKLYKGRTQSSSLMQSESDLSNEETIFSNKKPVHPSSMSNGKPNGVISAKVTA